MTGDIDADGHVDLVVTRPGSGAATVLYGDGDGAFLETHSVATGGSTVASIVAGDLDGDGRTDLVVGVDNDGGTTTPSVAVLRNSLDGRHH